ncbi:MAG: AsmA family protein [Xanthomonadaceae bacterium]|nr:AsmA family protein [Xanthomonadaceae bacterium]
MSIRLRQVLFALGALAAIAMVALVLAVYLLLQPERFTRMLQNQARAAGLELNLASPASPTLFPRPGLHLDGITLTAAGANAPILLAARGQLALPWRTLLGGPTVISQLRIDSPRVDLGALQDWLASVPAQPANAPPSIPRIDTGVSISHGSLVHGNAVLLDNISLDAGRLLSGQPFPLSLSATAAGSPWQLHLSATPRIQGNTLQLNDISLRLSQDNAVTLALGGSAHWHGAADAWASLAGKLDQADGSQYDIELALTPADQDQPLLLALKLDGPDNHVDLRLPPLALAHWWSQLGVPQEPQLAVPPGSGKAAIEHIHAGSVDIEGFSMQAGDSVPAGAASAAAPPRSSRGP